MLGPRPAASRQHRLGELGRELGEHGVERPARGGPRPGSPRPCPAGTRTCGCGRLAAAKTSLRHERAAGGARHSPGRSSGQRFGAQRLRERPARRCWRGERELRHHRGRGQRQRHPLHGSPERGQHRTDNGQRRGDRCFGRSVDGGCRSGARRGNLRRELLDPRHRGGRHGDLRSRHGHQHPAHERGGGSCDHRPGLCHRAPHGGHDP